MITKKFPCEECISFAICYNSSRIECPIINKFITYQKSHFLIDQLTRIFPNASGYFVSPSDEPVTISRETRK